MPSQKNQDQVVIIKEKLEKAHSAAVVEYSGTSGTELTKLRSELKQAGGGLFVTKNTLIDVAIGRGRISDSLDGMNALVLSYKDAVAALKALFTLHKESEKLTIKQGWVNDGDQVLSVDQLKSLSEMPSKEQLVAKLLYVLRSPAQGIVNVVKAGPRNLVYALKAIADKQTN